MQAQAGRFLLAVAVAGSILRATDAMPQSVLELTGVVSRHGTSGTWYTCGSPQCDDPSRCETRFFGDPDPSLVCTAAECSPPGIGVGTSCQFSIAYGEAGPISLVGTCGASIELSNCGALAFDPTGLYLGGCSDADNSVLFLGFGESGGEAWIDRRNSGWCTAYVTLDPWQGSSTSTTTTTTSTTTTTLPVADEFPLGTHQLRYSIEAGVAEADGICRGTGVLKTGRCTVTFERDQFDRSAFYRKCGSLKDFIVWWYPVSVSSWGGYTPGTYDGKTPLRGEAVMSLVDSIGGLQQTMRLKDDIHGLEPPRACRVLHLSTYRLDDDGDGVSDDHDGDGLYEPCDYWGSVRPCNAACRINHPTNSAEMAECLGQCVAGCDDNCPTVPNAVALGPEDSQRDANGDGIGEACQDAWRLACQTGTHNGGWRPIWEESIGVAVDVVGLHPVYGQVIGAVQVGQGLYAVSNAIDDLDSVSVVPDATDVPNYARAQLVYRRAPDGRPTEITAIKVQALQKQGGRRKVEMRVRIWDLNDPERVHYESKPIKTQLWFGPPADPEVSTEVSVKLKTPIELPRDSELRATLMARFDEKAGDPWCAITSSLGPSDSYDYEAPGPGGESGPEEYRRLMGDALDLLIPGMCKDMLGRLKPLPLAFIGQNPSLLEGAYDCQAGKLKCDGARRCTATAAERPALVNGELQRKPCFCDTPSDTGGLPDFNVQDKYGEYLVYPRPPSSPQNVACYWPTFLGADIDDNVFCPNGW